MTKVYRIKLAHPVTLGLFLLAFAMNLAASAHGPTMPPDPWVGLSVMHGPTMPPDPWVG
jgi:hypothetical protein